MENTGPENISGQERKSSTAENTAQEAASVENKGEEKFSAPGRKQASGQDRNQVSDKEEPDGNANLVNVNVIPQNIPLLKENELLDRLSQELHDWEKGSRYNWRIAIRALGQETIQALLTDTMVAYHQGKIKKSKAHYFMYQVKQVGEERGYKLWKRQDVKPADEMREQAVPGLVDFRTKMVMQHKAAAQDIRTALQEENNS